jgi:hypothetical protein
VAWLVTVALLVTLIVSAGLEMRIFLLISREILLPTTPLWATAAAMLLLLGYTAARGMEAHARAAEVLALVLFLPAIFMLGLAIWQADFTALAALPEGNLQDIGTRTLRLGFIFTGMPALLLAAFVTGKPKQNKSLPAVVSRALLIAGAAVVAVTVLTIAAFGADAVLEQWPVVTMMDAVAVPGGFMPRREAAMFGMWIATAFVLGGALILAATRLLREFVPIKQGSGALPFVVAAAVFGVAMLPLGTDGVYRILDYMYMTTGVFFLVVLPLLVFLAKKNMLRASAVFLLIFLAGCWDAVEIEDRALVSRIEIDEQYNVTLSSDNFTKTSQGDTLENAFANIKAAFAEDGLQVYYGQVQEITAPPHASDFLRGLPKLSHCVINRMNQTNQSSER